MARLLTGTSVGALGIWFLVAYVEFGSCFQPVRVQMPLFRSKSIDFAPRIVLGGLDVKASRYYTGRGRCDILMATYDEASTAINMKNQNLTVQEENAPIEVGLHAEGTASKIMPSGVASVTPVKTASAPGVTQILRFAIPAIGVWLCSPLLSLIDTSAVGILSGTIQQAALAPAVSITDYGALLMAFLYTGTTNLVASAQEKDKEVEGGNRTREKLIAALQLSSFVGIGFGLMFGLFSKLLIKLIIANDAVDPVVFTTAVRYCRIRSLGMPAAAVIGSAQAACLGMQDMRSPLYVLLVAAVVNFCGDMLMVGNSNPWIGGAAGAAWATVISQYTALALFMTWLKRKPRKSIETGVGAKKSGSLITKGFLAGKFRMKNLLKFPPMETAKEFAPFVVSVSTMSIGRISGYIAMSHVASSTLGVLEMAAQQILFAFFCCFIPIVESLNLTAQSFVPAIFEKKVSRARTDALKETILNFMKAGGVMGLAMVSVMSCIPLLSRFFTLDAAVIGKVNSATPYLAMIFALFGFVNSGEGLLVGQKDLGYLGKAYAIWFFAVPYFMLRLKKAAASGASIGVASMWRVFAGYQVVRLATWLLRLRQLHQRRRAEEVTDNAAI